MYYKINNIDLQQNHTQQHSSAIFIVNINKSVSDLSSYSWSKVYSIFNA